MVLRLVAMALDPFLDVIRLETEMTTEPVVGDRIAMTTRGPPVYERLGDAEDFCHLFDVEVARRQEELKLLGTAATLLVVRFEPCIYLDHGEVMH